MDIKKIIENRCAISLPISGKLGNRKNHAVSINSAKNYIEVQNQFISCLIGNSWRKYEQKLLLNEDNTVIDQINVALKTEENLIVYLNFYFDISKCI